MTNDDYERELTGSREEIATVLNDVADGLRSGAVRLGEDGDAVTVATPEELTLEVELETEDGEQSLELELEWPVSEADAAAETDAVDESDAATEMDAAAEGAAETDAVPETDAAAGSAESPSDVEIEAPTIAGAADATQSLAGFEVYRDAGGEWRWRLRHRNGNIIATGGEGYTRKHNALKGLRSVVKNSPGATVSDEFSD
ncbi:hypothetical protein GCM10027435_15260 [Haloparvum alkalitolerans]|uniref:amphi-Trp domain-containing protein n=1 Tax=Haloparvum alkalitolerans TaxID=1042953 RepID=UPI003CF7D2E5